MKSCCANCQVYLAKKEKVLGKKIDIGQNFNSIMNDKGWYALITYNTETYVNK